MLTELLLATEMISIQTEHKSVPPPCLKEVSFRTFIQ